jgi:probable phosphoglycerate mutase
MNTQPVQRPLAIYLVRHGEAAIPRHEPPPMGPPLTIRGRIQAMCLHLRLTRYSFKAVYSSDLTRAIQTARIATPLPLRKQIHTTPDLREVSANHAGIHLSHGVEARTEDITLERNAIYRFFNMIHHEYGAGDRLLIFAHGNLIRTLIPLLTGSDPHTFPLLDIRNTSLTTVEMWPSGARIMRMANCVRHLPPGMAT